MSKRARYSKWINTILPVLVLALMGAIVYRQRTELRAISWHIRPGLIVLTLLLHSLALAATFVVWHLMISHLGGFSDLKSNLRVYYVSTLAKRIPTAFWYIGGRLLMYGEVGVLASQVINCVVLENVLIGIAGVITLLALLPFYSGVAAARMLPLGLVAALGLTALLLRPRVFVDATNWVLRRFDKREIDVAPTRAQIALWSAIYILPWLFAGGAFYCATHALIGHVELDLIDAMGISTVSMLVALLSLLLPAGMGLKELTSSALLARWLPFSAAIAVSLAYRLLQTANEMVWALVATAISPSDGQD